MKAKGYRLLALLLCLTLLVAAGCAPGAAGAQAQPVTLKLLLRGSATGLERVLENLYSQMEEGRSWRLEITLVSSADYARRLAGSLTAHEDYDLVFDAPWLSLNTQAEQHSYKNLKNYFNNPEYPALQAAFQPDYLHANLVAGEQYAIPFTSTYYDVPGIYYRKDLLQQMGLGFDAITTRAQLESYWAGAEALGYKAITLGSRGFYLLNSPEIAMRRANIWDVTGWSFWDYPAKIVLSAQGDRVVDVVFPGDDTAHFAALPAPYNSNFLDEGLLQNAADNRYLDPDDLLQNDGKSAFLRGAAASYESELGSGGSAQVQQQLQVQVAQGTVGFWAYEDTFAAQNLQKGSIPTNHAAWNYLCIPSYSSDPDEAMKFLDWLYSDWARLDMFNYGLEGVDWQADGADGYTLLTNPAGAFSFPAYELAWNPNHYRIDAGLCADEKALMDFMMDPASYTASPLEGYSIRTGRIAIELACLNALYNEYYIGFTHGAYAADTAQKIAEFHARSETLGLETVRAELIAQVQRFLDGKEN